MARRKTGTTPSASTAATTAKASTAKATAPAAVITQAPPVAPPAAVKAATTAKAPVKLEAATPDLPVVPGRQGRGAHPVVEELFLLVAARLAALPHGGAGF